MKQSRYHLYFLSCFLSWCDLFCIPFYSPIIFSLYFYPYFPTISAFLNSDCMVICSPSFILSLGIIFYPPFISIQVTLGCNICSASYSGFYVVVFVNGCVFDFVCTVGSVLFCNFSSGLVSCRIYTFGMGFSSFLSYICWLLFAGLFYVFY